MRKHQTQVFAAPTALRRKKKQKALLPLALVSAIWLVLPGMAWAADAICRDAAGNLIGTTSGSGDEVACGEGAVTTGEGAIAIGKSAKAMTLNSVAIGIESWAHADGVAIGGKSRAQALNISIGSEARASGYVAGDVAIGFRAAAFSSMSFIDLDNRPSAIAIGANTNANGVSAIAIGANATVDVGYISAWQRGSIAIGAHAAVRSIGGVALGDLARVAEQAERAVAIGTGAEASHVHAVALGYDSVTAAPESTSSASVEGITYNFAGGTVAHSTVSLGRRDADPASDIKRTITHLAAGRVTVDSTDAINGSQLYATQVVIGRAVSQLGVDVTGDPAQAFSVNIGGTNYTTVSSAIHALAASGGSGGGTGTGTGTGPMGPQGPAGPAGQDGAQGVAGPAGPMGPQGPKGDKGDKGDAANINLVAGRNITVNHSGDTYTINMDDMPTFDGMASFNGGIEVAAGQTIDMGGNAVSNVGAGVADTDAVNLGQLKAAEAAARSFASEQDAEVLMAARQHADAGAAQSVSRANAYTDTRMQAVQQQFEQFTSQIDDRFLMQDRRISRHTAMSAAMMGMSANAAGSSSGSRGRFAAGVGYQGGQKAFAVGYGKRVGKTGSFSLGGSFSGGESTVSAGFGVEL